MGWSCAACGDVNPSFVTVCEECGTDQAAKVGFRLQAQPLSTSIMWIATLLGGGLSGYIIAIWNGRVLRRHSLLTTGIYCVIAIVGWLATVWCIANLEPAHEVNTSILLPEPGFAIPVALALGFLLVAIPYNRDTLRVNQWTWNHPGRKLVLSLGSKGLRLTYVAFARANAQLLAGGSEDRNWLTIPVLPVVVLVLSLVIGLVTLMVGNAFAVPIHHHHH